MSAISAEPMTLVAPEIGVRPSTTRVRPEPRVVSTPEVPLERARTHTRPKSKSKKATSQSMGTILVAHTTMFVSIAAVTVLVCTLWGQVMEESARREGIRAGERAAMAQKSEAALRQQVDMLTSDESVEAWAQSHGMVALDGFDKVTPGERTQLVAKNP